MVILKRSPLVLLPALTYPITPKKIMQSSYKSETPFLKLIKKREHSQFDFEGLLPSNSGIKCNLAFFIYL